MLFAEPAQFINDFVDSLNDAIKETKPNEELSRIQKGFIALCIMGILITNSVCWAKFERSCIIKCTVGSLSWMFRSSSIPWSLLLAMGVNVIISRYNIKSGVLTVDDTDKKRSKVTKRIPFIHKLKDKSTGGFLNGQCIVFLVLVTPTITIPVSFAFHEPDPKMTAWNKLKKKGEKRPDKPPKNPNYPTKIEIALNLINEFVTYFSKIKIKCVVGDALYGTAQFLNKTKKILGTKQVISQIRKNQNIRFRGKKRSVEDYFEKNKGVESTIKVRGKKVKVTMLGLRVYLYAHKTKRFVIALKYEGESDYRYIVASDMTWCMKDIVEAYSLRWLIEVFIQDWKSYEGWNNLTKQRGKEGSSKSLILSLLVDHCLFLHPKQLVRFKNKLPAWTVGSLSRLIRKDSLMSIIEDIISSENPKKKFRELSKTLKKLFALLPSDKHMINKDIGRLDSTPALNYKGKK